MTQLEPGSFEGTTFCKTQIGADLDVLGYRVLIRAPIVKETTKSGLIVPDSTRNEKQRYENAGLVLELGPHCFKGEGFKYDTEPRFRIGDWVYYSSYEKEKYILHSFVCYFITDDRVHARIPEADLAILLENMF